MATATAKKKKVVVKTYEWVEGRRMKGGAKRANVVGRIIEGIADRNGGRIDAKDLLAVARPKNSPIHDMFEWDDTTAAERYRVEQARHVLRSVQVRVTGGTKKPVVTKAFPFVDDNYIPVEQVYEDKGLRNELLREALREGESWMARYEHLAELASVFQALRRLM